MVEINFCFIKTKVKFQIECVNDQKLGDICKDFYSKYIKQGNRTFESFIFKFNDTPINFDMTIRQLANKKNSIDIRVEEINKVEDLQNSKLRDAYLGKSNSLKLENSQNFDSKSKLQDYNNNDYEENNEIQNISNNNIFFDINSNCFPKYNSIKSLFNTNPDELRNNYKTKKENYFCSLHGNEYGPERFIYYWLTCKQDLCYLCKKKHLGHNIIDFDQNHLIRTNEDLEECKQKCENIYNNYSQKIKNIKNNINFFEDRLNLYFEIIFKLIKEYNSSNRNYKELLKINLICKKATIEEGLNEFYENMINQLNNDFNKFKDIYCNNNDINL